MGSYDPFDMILNERMDDAAEGQEPLADALSHLRKSFDWARMGPLLESSNPRVVTNGLYLISEMGELPSEIVELALNHVRHPRWNARFYLANCLLVSNRILSPSQLGKALPLVEDENPDVRCKMMELLATTHGKLTESEIEDAADLHCKTDHLKGLTLLQNSDITNDSLIEVVGKEGPVVRCYAGARILLNAKAGSPSVNFPTNENPEIEYLVWRLNQIARRTRK